MAKKKKDETEAETEGGAGGTATESRTVVRVSSHPRASASIRRLRGRAGLGAFVVCLLLSVRAGLPAFDAVARGLVAGVAAQFAVWFAAVLVWRHLIVAELALHREALEAAQAERRAAAEAARAAAVPEHA
jgi:hypothetical protein